MPRIVEFSFGNPDSVVEAGVEPMEDLSALPPDRLFELFEAGAIDRDTLQSLMALQARALIAEMEDDRLNPAAAVLEHFRNLRAIFKLVRRHGQKLVRDTFVALARVPGFPPSMHLWNASHPDVPLHCFLRTKREPVFRVLRFETDGTIVRIEVEYGVRYPKALHREYFTLKRNPLWQLYVDSRETRGPA
jgi:hypothetical protein